MICARPTVRSFPSAISGHGTMLQKFAIFDKANRLDMSKTLPLQESMQAPNSAQATVSGEKSVQ